MPQLSSQNAPIAIPQFPSAYPSAWGIGRLEDWGLMHHQGEGVSLGKGATEKAHFRDPTRWQDFTEGT